jgi:phage terminase large subunit-like protein
LEFKNLQLVKDYARNIVNGQKIACKELTQACQRFLDHLDDDRYELKPKDAEFCIAIIEGTFVHIKGHLKGKPYLLEDWQKFIIYNLVSIYLKGTDERLYKESLIYIPRKNGKTFFASALIWALSLLERAQFSSVYLVAQKLERALEGFYNILENLEHMGERENFRVLDNNSEHSISRSFYDAKGIKTGAIRIHAIGQNAKKADGMASNVILLDEIHALKSNEYFVYKQAMKAYRNKLLVGISTAGSDMNSFLYGRLQYCQKILSREVEDEQYFIFIAKADNPDNYTDEVEHEKANPNYRVTIRPEDMNAEAYQAANEPASRSEFLNKSLNIYTNTMSTYFDVGAVQYSNEQSEKVLKTLLKIKEHQEITHEMLSKLPIQWIGGADLSKVHDLTASCLYGQYEGIDISISHGFIPITTAKLKSEEDNIPLFWWKDKGWLTMTNSPVVDYEEVVKWFKSMRDKGFKIKQVVFDKYNSRDFVKSMERQKFKMAEASQRYWMKSEGFRFLERSIKKNTFYYVNNKTFEYCISNVKASEDAEERVRFEKVSEKYRIDLFDATIIAIKQHIINKDKKKKMNDWL